MGVDPGERLQFLESGATQLRTNQVVTTSQRIEDTHVQSDPRVEHGHGLAQRDPAQNDTEKVVRAHVQQRLELIHELGQRSTLLDNGIGLRRVTQSIEHLLTGACVENYGHTGCQLAHLGNRLVAAHDRHLQIQDHGLRCESGDQNQGLGAVALFTDDFHVLDHAESSANEQADLGTVVDNQDAARYGDARFEGWSSSHVRSGRLIGGASEAAPKFRLAITAYRANNRPGLTPRQQSKRTGNAATPGPDTPANPKVSALSSPAERLC